MGKGDGLDYNLLLGVGELWVIRQAVTTNEGVGELVDEGLDLCVSAEGLGLDVDHEPIGGRLEIAAGSAGCRFDIDAQAEGAAELDQRIEEVDQTVTAGRHAWRFELDRAAGEVGERIVDLGVIEDGHQSVLGRGPLLWIGARLLPLQAALHA